MQKLPSRPLVLVSPTKTTDVPTAGASIPGRIRTLQSMISKSGPLIWTLFGNGACRYSAPQHDSNGTLCETFRYYGLLRVYYARLGLKPTHTDVKKTKQSLQKRGCGKLCRILVIHKNDSEKSLLRKVQSCFCTATSCDTGIGSLLFS